MRMPLVRPERRQSCRIAASMQPRQSARRCSAARNMTTCSRTFRMALSAPDWHLVRRHSMLYICRSRRAPALPSDIMMKRPDAFFARLVRRLRAPWLLSQTQTLQSEAAPLVPITSSLMIHIQILRQRRRRLLPTAGIRCSITEHTASASAVLKLRMQPLHHQLPRAEASFPAAHAVCWL